jgi:predicted RNase H-like HicB family nuclease
MYAVAIPDLNISTQGADVAEAMYMARDAMSMWLCDAEDKDEPIPAARSLQDIPVEPSAFVNLIDVDTDEYRRENDNRAVKKTLSIPNWLNAKAEKAGVNFSQTLQKALKRELGLE